MKTPELFAMLLGAALALNTPAQTNAPPTFRLAGKVVDAEGRPVAGAVVERYESSADLMSGIGGREVLKDHVITEARGLFEFAHARAPMQVIARKPGFAPAWNQYGQFRRPGRDTTDERLVLRAPTTVGGTVVDEAGKPVADAEVWVTMAISEQPVEDGGTTFTFIRGKPARDCFSTRTAADGKFRIEGLPASASADLAVSKPGKVLRQPQRDYIGPDTMMCRAGQQDIKLVLEPAGSIEGKVVGLDTGQPVAGALLGLLANRPGYIGGLGREPAKSGADGSFRMPDVAPGNYVLRATFGTNAVPQWVADTVAVTVEAGQATRDVQVSATRGGFLEIAVLGKEDHNPLAKVNLNARKGAYSAAGATDAKGTALLRLPAGDYQVTALRENSSSQGTSAVVESGQTNRVEIELSPPPKITGVVRDPAGAPAPGLVLQVLPEWRLNLRDEVKTDAHGRYEMPWNPQRFGGQNETMCLIARDPARNLAVAQDLEENTKTLDLRLEPGLVVAGRVEDVSGHPLTNATVQLCLWCGNMGPPFDNRPYHADAQGRFEISALPPGRKYSATATAKGFGSANQQIASEDAETNRIQLEPFVLRVADHKLAGQVVDADDKPVTAAWVHIFGPGQPNDNVRTDNQGRFIFARVCEGSIQVSANSQRAYGNVQAEAGDTNVVLRLGENQSFSARAAAPRRPSLKGKPLPDLAAVNLATDAAPAGKPVLLCLFDLEQRPSRRFIKSLAEQHDALKLKGLTVLALQAAVTTPESLKEWKDANPPPFPVGYVTEKSAKTKWATEIESLPWLILTDSARRVTAEGFDLDELDAKLKAPGK